MSVCRAEDGEHLITWVTRVSSSECFSHGVRCTHVYTCTHSPVPILPPLLPLSGLLALEEINRCLHGEMLGWMELESLEIHMMLKIDENFYLGVKYIFKSDFFPLSIN